MVLDLGVLSTYHTLVSIIAILAGTAVVTGLLTAGPARGGAGALVTNIFVVTAFITSASGYLFPFNDLLPSHIVGGIALAVLVMVVAARFALHMPRLEAAGLVASLYFLVFVGLAQAFAKLSALRDLAPTQSEPPFAVAQGLLLLLFLYLGVRATRRDDLPVVGSGARPA